MPAMPAASDVANRAYAFNRVALATLALIALRSSIANAQAPPFEHVHQVSGTPQNFEGRAIAPVMVNPDPDRAYLVASSPQPPGTQGPARFQYLDANGAPSTIPGRSWEVVQSVPGANLWLEVRSLAETPAGGFLVAGVVNENFGASDFRRSFVGLLDANLNLIASTAALLSHGWDPAVKGITLPFDGRIVHMFQSYQPGPYPARAALSFHSPTTLGPYALGAYTTANCDHLRFTDIVDGGERIYAVGELVETSAPNVVIPFLMWINADAGDPASHGVPVKLWLFPDNVDGFNSSYFTSVVSGRGSANGTAYMAGYSTRIESDGTVTTHLRVVAFNVLTGSKASDFRYPVELVPSLGAMTLDPGGFCGGSAWFPRLNIAGSDESETLARNAVILTTFGTLSSGYTTATFAQGGTSSARLAAIAVDSIAPLRSFMVGGLRASPAPSDPDNFLIIHTDCNWGSTPCSPHTRPVGSPIPTPPIVRTAVRLGLCERCDGTTFCSDVIFHPPLAWSEDPFEPLVVYDLCPEPGATLRGFKFNDLDGNGFHDPGEPKLPGWQINISDGAGYAASVVTDATGEYTFIGLPLGTYTVTETQQPGWSQTSPSSGSHVFTVTGPHFYNGLDFGNRACGEVEILEVLCDTKEGSVPPVIAGQYSVTFRVTNHSGQPVSWLLFPDAGVTPTSIDLTSNPIPVGGTFDGTVHIQSSERHACLSVLLANVKFEECCLLEECFDLPECNCLQVTDQFIIWGLDPDDGFVLSGAFALTVQNLASYPTQHFFILPMAPTGMATMPSVIHLGTPLQPGQSASINFNATFAPPVTFGTPVHFRITQHSPDYAECCYANWSWPLAPSGEERGSGLAEDLNGDMLVDGLDLALLLGQWGGSGSADLNADGTVDGIDLSTLLGAWSPIPEGPP